MKGTSLHIGVNVVDYKDLPLKSAENDAKAMRRIAGVRGYRSRTLLVGKKATTTKVYSKIRQAAKRLVSGEAFLLTFAGHGDRISDQSGDEKKSGGKKTGMDSVWCLSDKPLGDDKIYDLLTGFRPGVRVLIVADACNSGTVLSKGLLVVKNLLPDDLSPLDENDRRKIDVERVQEPAGLGVRRALRRILPTVVAKALPRAGEVPHLQVDRRPFSAQTKTEATTKKSPAPKKAKVLWQPAQKKRKAVVASVILLAASQDDQDASEDSSDGVFTGRLLEVWNNGNFKGDLLDFFAAIKQKMPSDQKPNIFAIGKRDPSFTADAPFSI